MKIKQCSLSKKVWIVLLAGLALLLVQSLVYAADPVTASAAPKLANDDCAKCHSKPPADIAAEGRKHKTEIGCQDCHNGHPPTTKKIIPLCSQCHEGKAHFKLAACTSCHSNPHTPLKITFGNNVTDPYVTNLQDKTV